MVKYSVCDVILDANPSWDTGQISKDNKILIENLRIDKEWGIKNAEGISCYRQWFRNKQTTFQIIVTIFKQESFYTL